MRPKVTIIVPVYNTARYLESCIESLKKIDFNSYEVIFIDNHSSDGSFEILKKIDKKNFKVYRNRKNFGQSYDMEGNLKECIYISTFCLLPYSRIAHCSPSELNYTAEKF